MHVLGEINALPNTRPPRNTNDNKIFFVAVACKRENADPLFQLSFIVAAVMPINFCIIHALSHSMCILPER